MPLLGASLTLAVTSIPLSAFKVTGIGSPLPASSLAATAIGFSTVSRTVFLISSISLKTPSTTGASANSILTFSMFLIIVVPST